MNNKEKQALKEMETATKQLDMWASALGMSKEDVKNCKLKAIQELAEEADSEEKQKCEGCSGGCSCKRSEISYTNADPMVYLSVLGMLLGTMTHTNPPVNIHLHISK